MHIIMNILYYSLYCNIRVYVTTADDPSDFKLRVLCPILYVSI